MIPSKCFKKDKNPNKLDILMKFQIFSKKKENKNLINL